MDSLSDILSNKDYSMPDEVSAIKTFVAAKYGQDVSVTLQPKQIVIAGRSASLIANLRMNLPELKQTAGIDKPIRFRIG